MHLRCFIAAALVPFVAAASAAPNEHGKTEHIVLVVWDGMRPDFVTPQHAPTLAALAGAGVFFRQNHPAFPSSTNVNGAAIATGDYPGHDGIIANQEFRPEIDPHKPFDTSDFPGLDDGGRISQTFIATPTFVEDLHKAGFRTAIAGSKPVAQLFDRSRIRESAVTRDSVVLFRGKTVPANALQNISAVIGSFPKREGFPNAGQDAWTTRALTDVFWKDDVPKFSLLWLSEPDLSQHDTAPGSPTSLAAIKSCDDNLAKVIAALKAKNAFATADIFVVSDHGFSTIDLALDAAQHLREAGFDAVRRFAGPPKPGQVLVVSLGGSIEFYVARHDADTVRRLVDYLQHSDFAGVILTRTTQKGTFTLAQLHLKTPDAPDVLVSARWNDRPNKFGTPGEVASDIGEGLDQGTHASLSRFDMHNTLIASGPDFRQGWNDETPSGNIDLAPTILSLLGLPITKSMDGRTMREAFRDAKTSPATEPRELVAERNLGNATWRQTVRLTTVGTTTYFLEGNGGRIPKKP
ncbi:MAG: alkaline phosphatase family protein [Chthoniobacterales bacterium]